MPNTESMDDAALDALLDSQYGNDGLALDVPVEDGGSTDNGSSETDVSPSDDVEVGQSDEEEVEPDVGQDTEDDEDPEDSLSPDEEEVGEDSDGAEVVDETTDVDQEDDSEDDSEADEPYAFQPLRADGKEYPIENMQELYTLASKGINADRKWGESAAGRKIAATLEKNGLTAEDINLLVDLKSGNQDAIASLLRSAEIDPLDIDVNALDGNYKAQDYSTGDFEMQLDEVVSRVKTQPRYQESVNVVMEQWDKSSKDEFYRNPQILELLNIDMQVNPETGFSMYDKVAPVAEKMKALDTGVPRSDLEYYTMAGKKVIDALNVGKQSQAESAEKEKSKAVTKKKTISKKKKAAASSGGVSSPKKVKDVTEMSDDELDKFLEETS